MKLYPLQFKEILQDRIWGGTSLHTILHKSNPSNTVGESWEISSLDDNISQVLHGFYKDVSLNELTKTYPHEILGDRVVNAFGSKFPLLFKFLDAQQDLSIQLHPNDVLAQKRHNSFGKTEMWYIMHAEENARIILGFKENASKDTYLNHLENNTLVDILNEISVKKGDVFFIETGTVHAIGAGIVLAEIQQTSDITYRIYDWDRVDVNGKHRELHTDLALEAINFDVVEAKVSYEFSEKPTTPLVHCSYFKTNVVTITDDYAWQFNSGSFTVFMCTEGSFSINCDDEIYQYTIGDTVLIPAGIKYLKLEGKATLLEIFI
jgi:mannose-6-phosphate isomerase